MPATELVLRKLLTLGAVEGLDHFGIDAGDRDRLLGIVEAWCVEGRNGATWQRDTVERLEAGGAARGGPGATARYRELMHANLPVHAWLRGPAAPTVGPQLGARGAPSHAQIRR